MVSILTSESFRFAGAHMPVEQPTSSYRASRWADPEPTEQDRHIEDLAGQYASLTAALAAYQEPAVAPEPSAEDADLARAHYRDHLALIAHEISTLRAGTIKAMKCKSAVIKAEIAGRGGAFDLALVESLICDIETL